MKIYFYCTLGKFIYKQRILFEDIDNKLFYFQSIGIRRSHILLIGNPPCDDAKWGVHCRETRGTNLLTPQKYKTAL